MSASVRRTSYAGSVEVGIPAVKSSLYRTDEANDNRLVLTVEGR